jgi:transposase InsO family protein
MRRNAHVRFGGRAEETAGWKHPHGASARPYTHVPTREGWVYVSFLQDGFSQRLLGFTVSTSKGAELVTRALDQAVNVRRRRNPTFVADGVIHHSDYAEVGVKPRSRRLPCAGAA